jgi:hypothetical protein
VKDINEGFCIQGAIFCRNPFLIPLRHPCEGRDPAFDFMEIFNNWIPAFAGMTMPS